MQAHQQAIAFKTTDNESSPELQALDAADIDGLGKMYRETGLDVNLSGAQRRGSEIWVSVAGVSDLDELQHYFTPTIRWVSRAELLNSQ